MKLRWVFRRIPVPVFVTDRLPEDVGACMPQWAPVVLLRPKYMEDEGLLQHQLEHVRQWWLMAALMASMTMFGVLIIAPVIAGPLPPGSAFLGLWLSLATHAVMYQLSPVYRALTEVSAYRAQMRYPDRAGVRMPVAEAASRLASGRYALNISEQKARQLLGI